MNKLKESIEIEENMQELQINDDKFHLPSAFLTNDIHEENDK